jgi:Dyp-type peroxidase family
MATTLPAGIDFDEIQGNILGGFFKDHQMLLFLHFTDADLARLWVRDITPDVATSAEVTAFNDAFKVVGKRGGRRSAPIKATWINVAFTHTGLAALGVAQADLDAFPDDFKEGMAARAALLGDDGASDPANWIAPLGSPSVHAVVILASDEANDLREATNGVTNDLTKYGVDLLYQQSGEARTDQPGHEHFGFDDGVSQPGVLGVTPAQNPADPNQGQPGQDLLQPGEFVIGYERQPQPTPPVPQPGQPGYAPVPTPSPSPSPSAAFADPKPPLTKNGSYLVFRRLRQDVPAFHSFVLEQAAAHGVTNEVMGAKLVGRYASGAPLEPLKDDPIPAVGEPNAGDPAVDHPEILDFSHINNFEYGADQDGGHVPRAAHIRKAYPRDQAIPGEAETQTHRILRRGVAYGKSYDLDAARGAADDDRGLLFLCYQTSIQQQFEFVQSRWVNTPAFPEPDDGHDPIISQKDEEKSITIPLAGQSVHISFIQRWVTTTGGEYFFQPSLSALTALSARSTPPT